MRRRHRKRRLRRLVLGPAVAALAGPARAVVESSRRTALRAGLGPVTAGPGSAGAASTHAPAGAGGAFLPAPLAALAATPMRRPGTPAPA